MKPILRAEVPFADQPRAVTGILQQLRPDGELPVQPVVFFLPRVDPVGNADFGAVTGSDQTHARRAAHRRDDKRIRKAGALPGQTIHIGCVDVRIAVRADAPSRLIVGVEQNNVGPFGSASGGRTNDTACQRAQARQPLNDFRRSDTHSVGLLHPYRDSV